MTTEEEKTIRLFLSWSFWQLDVDHEFIDKLVSRFMDEFDDYKKLQPKLVESCKKEL